MFKNISFFRRFPIHFKTFLSYYNTKALLYSCKAMELVNVLETEKNKCQASVKLLSTTKYTNKLYISCFDLLVYKNLSLVSRKRPINILLYFTLILRSYYLSVTVVSLLGTAVSR